MSFATSLLALSLHSLANQPIASAHSGTEAAYVNFFTAMGAIAIRQDVKINAGSGQGNHYWCPDMVVDFGEFQVIVEVKTHIGTMGFISKSTPNADGKQYLYDNLFCPVKQLLAYFTKGVDFFSKKPTICMAVTNLEFVVFNPSDFKKRHNLLDIMTATPSMFDHKANEWVKSKRAFKKIKKQSVSAFNKITPDEFKAMIRKTAGLPEVKEAQELLMVAE